MLFFSYYISMVASNLSQILIYYLQFLVFNKIFMTFYNKDSCIVKVFTLLITMRQIFIMS